MTSLRINYPYICLFIYISGKVYLTGVLNYQDTHYYDINITLSDGIYADWKILHVKDVAHAPSFSNLPSAISVEEDAPLREIIYAVTSSDRDYDKISYKLGNATPFTIDNQSA